MPDIGLISQSIDFIEDNLRMPIAVADMADAVGYSLYHFCRVFNQATHHTPYDYLMRRRLAEAARELRQTRRRIIDIALDYQFNSPETFSRAFKRVLGMQPSQYSKQGRKAAQRPMPRLTSAHLQHMGRGVSVTPVLEEMAPLQLVGVMAPVGDDLTALSELWHLLGEELAECGEQVRPGDYYGCLWYPQGWSERNALYMAAVKTRGGGPDVGHSALLVKTIPPLRCARFIHRGRTEDLPLTLDYVYHTWLPKSGHSLAHPLLIEQVGPTLANLDSRQSERGILIPIA
jgi:AraC family transcriptional regulator